MEYVKTKNIAKLEKQVRLLHRFWQRNNRLKLGITTRSFGGLSTEETAKAMQEAGFVCTELCFTQSDLNGWSYNGRADISNITPELVLEKANLYREHGIEVTSIGVFTSLFEPDDDERKKNLDFFVEHMNFASYAGIKILATECGFVPGKRGINADTYEKDFIRMKESTTFLAAEAKKRGLTIAIESCVLDIIPSAKRLHDFISQIKNESGLDNVCAMLDPANLIANSSEDDMFSYLSSHIAYFHGKDRFVNDTYGRLVGDGDIDWVRFFKKYIELTPDCPFILEYSNKDNCIETKKRVDKYLSWAENN